jgi:hypothetical protein
MRRNLRNLKLRAIAAVDNPCQEHAKALVIKRALDPGQAGVAMRVAELQPTLKYICENDGAHSFSEVLTENKFSQDVWPCVDALSQSIRSIVGDASLTGGEREAKISASVSEFLNSVREISPEVSKQLELLLVRKRDDPMPKTVEELQADVTKLEGQVGDLTTKLTAAEEAKIKADAECKTAKAALDAVKAEGGELATVKAELATAKAALTAATDDVVKVGGQEIKKSEVGDANFKTMKAISDERDMALLGRAGYLRREGLRHSEAGWLHAPRGNDQGPRRLSDRIRRRLSGQRVSRYGCELRKGQRDGSAEARWPTH